MLNYTKYQSRFFKYKMTAFHTKKYHILVNFCHRCFAERYLQFETAGACKSSSTKQTVYQHLKCYIPSNVLTAPRILSHLRVLA